MKTLQEIFNEIGNLTDVDYGANDKGGKIHTYLETYDRLFAPFRNGCTLMEIGLAMGDSLKLWDAYFNNSEILGIDLSIVFKPAEYKNIVVVYAADATKPEFAELINGSKFDIVIDDGSHVTADQIKTFNLLRDKMKPGAIYIIEDILALDIERHKYLELHHSCEIIDMRHTGRFDNVLIIYRF